MTRGRVLLLAVVVAVVAAGAWLTVRSLAGAEPDWSALPPVTPDPAEVWEPDPAALEQLRAVDPCALLLRIDPDVEATPTDDLRKDSVEPIGDVCRTTPRSHRLRVQVRADPASSLLAGTPGYYAWAGEQSEVDGAIAWSVPAEAPRGHCAVYLPAGAARGLLVRAEDGPLCRESGGRLDLLDRVDRALRAWPADLPLTPTGEPSLRGEGACADLLEQYARRCVPHLDRDATEPGVAMIRGGEADPDVLCGAALAAAEEAGLSGVHAVTADSTEKGTPRACVLLPEGRDWTVWLRTERDAIGTAAPLELGGHAARKNPYGAPVYEIALDEPDERGLAQVSFESPDGSLIEPDWAQPLLDELAQALLG